MRGKPGIAVLGRRFLVGKERSVRPEFGAEGSKLVWLGGVAEGSAYVKRWSNIS